MGLLEVSIRFPHLGIELENLPKTFSVFGLEIAFYGVIIALGMIAGYAVAQWQARRTNQSPELYLDFAMYAIVISILGARAYYVIFSWDEYKDDILQVFNIRGGGLAIYGGIIAAVLTAIVYSRVKKISFRLLADTGCTGLVTGQIIGRWGNFFNREAFGSYTDNLFAMQLMRNEVSQAAVANDPAYLENLKVIDGIEYIQVHPTFLYESMWNFALLIVLLVYTKYKKFDGELILIYLGGYGLGRAIIEGLRTDQLLLWNTNIAISQAIGIVTAVICFGLIIYKRVRMALVDDNSKLSRLIADKKKAKIKK